MPKNCTKISSDENRKLRALKIIEAAKAKHRTNTKAVQGALETLAQLDHRPFIPNHGFSHGHQPSHTPNDGHHVPSLTSTSGTGVTVNGEIIPICQATTAEQHDSNLGWTEPAAPPENPFKEVAETLERIVSWLAEGRTTQRVGLRGLALITVLNPAAFQDRCSGSLSSIAKLFGLSRQELQRFTREIKELTRDKSWNGHNQRYLGREKNRAAALAYHKRVGHKIHATS